MPEFKLGVVESRFADIIWRNEPLSSGKLVKLCEKELSWKRTTTYTVLKKLCERGMFKNDNGTVMALVTKEEFFAAKSEEFIADTFEGSLPAFLAAFASKKQLSEEEIEEIQKMIDDARERRK